MAVHSRIFLELSYIFVAAILGGVVAWRLRQPLILGYVLAGIAISPYTLGPQVSDVHTFQVVAEVGVIFLMFSIGLEFSIDELLSVKWVSLGGGPLGIVLFMLMGAGIGKLLHWGTLCGVAMGMIVSVASTMVLLRLLSDRGELQSQHGKVIVGISLVEDVAVVVLTILMPAMVSLTPHHLLNIGLALGRAAAILVPIGVLAVYLVPRALDQIVRSRNEELFLLVLLAICLGTAALTEWAGLSLAVGAFAAGLIVSGSQYAHRALERLVPLRDAFAALFFVTVGILINPQAVLSRPALLLMVLAMVIVGKFVIWTGVVKLFGYSVKTSVLAATGLTQIGEFSFILVQVAYANGLVSEQFYSAVLAASLLSILINAFLVRRVPQWMGSKAA